MHRRTVVRLGLLLAGLLSSAPLLAVDVAEERRGDFGLAQEAAALASDRYDGDDLLGALRAYQRALFWTRLPGDDQITWPSGAAPDWVEEIVPLAMSLDRFDEAVRYALVLPPSATNDPQTLRRLALYAREQRRWVESVRLQERWLATQSGSATGFDRLMVQLEIGRLHFLADNAAAASAAFEPVQRALVGKQLSDRARSRLESGLGGSLATTWEVFGEAHLEAERTSLAAEAFGRLAQLPDAADRAAYWLARQSLASKRPLAAYELLRKSLESASDRGDDSLGSAPYALLADIFRRLNQPDGAVDELRRLATDQPDNLTASLMLGIALKDLGRGDEAETTLADVVRRALQDSDIDPLLLELSADEAPEPDYAAIAIAGDWLLTRYGQIGNSDAFLELAAHLQDLFGELGDFESALSAAFEGNADFTSEVFSLADSNAGNLVLSPALVAELAIAAGRYERAGRAYRSAVESAADAEARQETVLQWWRGLMLKDEHTAAAEALNWAIDNSVWPEEEAEPYFHLAATLVLADRPDDAFGAAQQAADRAPGDPSIVERMGWTLVQADRINEAIESYAHLVEFFDADPEPSTRDVLRSTRLSLSYLTDDRGDSDAAAEWALQTLDEFPDDAGALNDLGYLWTKKGKHLHRAARMAGRAVELEPDNAAYWDSLGWARFRLGQPREALAAVERALVLQSDTGESADGEILDHLGEIQSALGNGDAASRAWRESADAYDAVDDAEAEAKVRAKLTQ